MSNEPTELETVIEARWKAMLGNDPGAIESLLHERYIYVAESGKVYDKPAFLKAFGKGELHDFSGEMEIESMVIEGYSATVSCAIKPKLDGSKQRNLHKVHTLVRAKGKWLFLAGHYY